MDENGNKKPEGTEEPAPAVTKTKQKIKVRLQNPVVVERTAVPVATKETNPEETDSAEAPQKTRACERIKDVLKGVGLGVVGVVALGTAFVMATCKPEPEQLEEGDEIPWDQDGDDDSESSDEEESKEEPAEE